MNADNKLAPFNPTCVEAQEIALQMLNLRQDDVLFDLGCGDGRLLRKACQEIPGLQCVGIELDSVYVERALLQQDSRVEIREGNVLDTEVQNGGALSLAEDATAIFLFLLPKGLVKLKPALDKIVQARLSENKRFRVVSYMFSVKGWEPTEINRETKGECPIYLYDFFN